MTAILPIDPVLRRFRDTLADIYGARLVRVVLYGSRARGEASPESDSNVAVFLATLPDRWAELDRLADLSVRFLDEEGVYVDARPYSANDGHDGTPLMHEISRDGLEL
jgi:predicted nucleotidyltransferase